MLAWKAMDMTLDFRVLKQIQRKGKWEIMDRIREPGECLLTGSYECGSEPSAS
jgi:hypothetical protein